MNFEFQFFDEDFSKEFTEIADPSKQKENRKCHKNVQKCSR